MKRISFQIGDKTIGDGGVLIQSMGDRKTTEVDHLVSLTNHLSEMGLDMMRFSVLDEADAVALGEIKKRVRVPVIADIHFDASLASSAIEAGADKVRINPGNIPLSAMRNLLSLIRERDIPIRIGVNSGSLNRFKGKMSDPDEDYFLALDETLSIFEDAGISKIVLSVKTSDPKRSARLYRKAYQRYPYPLHVGLTEAGFGIEGAIKSAMAIAPILSEGIGDTLRISLADDRTEEMRACKTLLSLTGRRENIPQLIVCPSCGRTTYDLKSLAREVQAHLDTIFSPVRVAVMGCPVNGPGEASEADYGLAGIGRGDELLLFARGESIGVFRKEEALSRLFKLIDDFKSHQSS